TFGSIRVGPGTGSSHQMDDYQFHHLEECRYAGYVRVGGSNNGTFGSIRVGPGTGSSHQMDDYQFHHL
ncbi:hypothetical protein Q6251_33900, partial [Klebsiella quasipneumoniae]|nr:hypothetical protein [Klebsiella quasipneumoniae]